MIAGRSLVRVELARRLTKNYLSSTKLVPQLQSCSFHHLVNAKFRIGVVLVLRRDMDGSKQNKVSYEGRPISTQSSSSQCEGPQQDLVIDSENLQAVDEKNEAGNLGKEMYDGISSHPSTIQCENEVGDDQNVSIQSVDNSDEVGGLQGAQISLDGKNVTPIAATSSTVKHSSSIQAFSSLIRFIKGNEGATLKKIEEEIGVKIILPAVWRGDSINIEGDSAESVSKAAERMLAIIDEAVKSPKIDYSHFISLPLAIHPELVDKLNKFQNSILATENDVQPEALRIDSSIFIRPETFHLTVLMLKLWNKDLLKAAAEVLQSVLPKVVHALDARPISIRLNGLECMKGSFSKARVLYAPVEEIGGEERLLCACQVIIDAFVEAGLVLERDAKQTLKLHATVMNVRHRKSKHRRMYNDYFDARTVVDQYGSEDWGEYLIREAHLSERFASDQNGYYRCCASIPFPESLQLD